MKSQCPKCQRMISVDQDGRLRHHVDLNKLDGWAVRVVHAVCEGTGLRPVINGGAS